MTNSQILLQILFRIAKKHKLTAYLSPYKYQILETFRWGFSLDSISSIINIYLNKHPLFKQSSYSQDSSLLKPIWSDCQDIINKMSLNIILKYLNEHDLTNKCILYIDNINSEADIIQMIKKYHYTLNFLKCEFNWYETLEGYYFWESHCFNLEQALSTS